MKALNKRIKQVEQLFKNSDFGKYYREKKKIIVSIILISILFTPLAYLLQKKNNEALIRDKGSLVALDTEGYGGSSITVQAKKDGKHYRKNIYVEKKENKHREKTVEPKEPAADLIADVDEVCRMVKARGANGNIVVLPRQTESGIDLKWSSSNGGMAWILPLPIGILTVIYLYKNAEGKKKSEELAAKNEIMRDLPGFTDRLVMLLDSGLIYEDAVDIMIKSYGKRTERGGLWDFLSETKEKATGTGEEFESILQREAGRYKSREFTRLVTLIAENRYHGQDLRNKLRTMGEILWQERKRNAEERSKIAETKMAIPLGIMLTALIMVTAAPALMQI